MPKPKVRRTSSKKAGTRSSSRRTHQPKKSLKDYQNAWKKSEAADLAQFGTLPDGKYEGVIEEALFDGGQVKWTVTVSSPPDFEGRKAFLSHGLEPEQQPYLKGTLKLLGVDVPEDIEDLPEVLHGLQGTAVEINVRTKWNEKHQRDFTNAYFNGVLEDGEPGEEEEVVTTTEDEDEEGVELEVGSMVSFESDGEELTGEVTAVNEDTATVLVGDDEWDVEFEELSPAEEEAEEEEPEEEEEEASEGEDMVGKTVEFDYEGDMVQGKALRLDKDGNLEVEVNGEEWVIDPAEVTVVTKAKSSKKKTTKKKSVKKKF